MTIWKQAFRQTMPVAVAYISFGFVFGMLFTQAGLPWYGAILMAMTVYSGALQFVSLKMLSGHLPITEIFISGLLLSTRHIFYGVALLRKYAGIPFFKKLLLIFLLTDETFSIVSTADQTQTPNYFLAVSILNYLYWQIGCCVGALLVLEDGIKLQGLDFILTALFAVMAVEQIKQTKLVLHPLLASLCALILLFVAKDLLLVSALIFCFVFIIGETRWASRTS